MDRGLATIVKSLGTRPNPPSRKKSQNVTNDKLREKWRVMEDKKGRDAVFEFCQEETKTYTEIKIANLLNRIKVCCTPEEYAMEKFEAEKRMDDFSNKTKMEQARLLPERKLLEKKMRSFERGERHGIQSIHEKVKKIKKPAPHKPLAQMPLISPAEFHANKAPPPPTPAELEDSAKSLTQLGNLLTKFNEDEGLVGLDKKQADLLRRLIPIYKKLLEKQEKLRDLASREARLRERTHKPIQKLMGILEAANTAAVSDLYFLFTKANMKFRPRNVRVEEKVEQSFGFRVQQTTVGKQRIFYFSKITERSAADRAGMCQGDRLVELNEKNVESLSYEELTREIASCNEEEKLKVGPNGEKRKQITMLLSDPETDEYIQQKLDLPVMRFQVQSNVAFDAISTEWTKFRKKQKSRSLGFFSNTESCQEKLDLIQANRVPSPITHSPPPPPVIEEDPIWKTDTRKRRRSSNTSSNQGSSLVSSADFHAAGRRSSEATFPPDRDGHFHDHGHIPPPPSLSWNQPGHHEFDPHGRHPGAHGSHPVSNYHPDRRSSYDRQYDNRLSHPQPVGTWPEHAPRRRPSGGHPDAFRGGPPVDRWAKSGHHHAHIDRRMSTSRDLDARSHDRRESPRHPRDRGRHYYDQNSRYRPY